MRLIFSYLKVCFGKTGQVANKGVLNFAEFKGK